MMDRKTLKSAAKAALYALGIAFWIVIIALGVFLVWTYSNEARGFGRDFPSETQGEKREDGHLGHLGS